MERRRNRRRAKREAWFDQGVEAFQRLQPAAPPCYVCPLCTCGFTRKALDNGLLTLEHVPLKSLGGKPLVLTCRDCNTSAGAALDSQMLRREQIYDFAQGTMTRPARAEFEIAGQKVNVEVLAEGKNVHVVAPPEINDPRSEDAMTTEFQRLPNEGARQPREFRITFRESFHNRAALLSLLRAAYLTAFAALGYRYILWRELKIVRRQLTDTKTEVLRVFSVTMPTEPPSERRILLVERPEWLHSVGVQFGRHFVFLPWLSTAPGLYERLADESGRNQGVEVAGRPGPFPTTPRLALDFL